MITVMVYEIEARQQVQLSGPVSGLRRPDMQLWSVLQ